MNDTTKQPQNPIGRVLVIGATGKTGRRVANGLEARGIRVTRGSRSAAPPFEWNDESGWDACLDAVDAAYVTYAPDLAMPGATDAIRSFVHRAKAKGVRRVVLLSGRGEPEAQACERIVQESGLEWTVVRASWFQQNFSEGAFVGMVQDGRITLPAGDTPEPFVDVDDIAEVAITALTQDGHGGQIYEVTGPRLMTFNDVATELSRVTSRDIQFVQVPHDAFISEAKAAGAPQDVVWMLDYLFATVLDGRNAKLTDGVQRALGREPTDFREYARKAAETGVWQPSTPWN